MAGSDGSVFTINDFKGGLDTRKTALTAPAGTLRILDNAVINPGGEIEKRLAFVAVTTLPSQVNYIFGQGGKLHVFVSAPVSIPAGTCPVPIVQHSLFGALPEAFTVTDCEVYRGGFQLCATGNSGANYVVWGDDVGPPTVAYTGLIDPTTSTYAHGTFSRTFKSKMYRIDGQYLRFSGIGDPGELNPAAAAPHNGAGFINIADQDPDADELQGMEIYYNNMAIFSRMQTSIWTLDPDPVKSSLVQVLRVGSVAPHSILQFGTGDIMFLADSGVRSLHSLYLNSIASFNDVGSAIDPILVPEVRDNPAAAAKARAIVQPLQGRYWLHLNGKIYVLSYFPAGKITAWSRFDPGFVVQEFAVVQNRVFARGPDGVLYLYGGPNLNTYDSCPVTVRTPHLAIETPTTQKRIKSLDVMCVGAWSLSVGMLPNNLNAFELVANLTDNTYGGQTIPFAGAGSHMGVQMVHQAPGAATLAAVHASVQEGWTK